MKKIVIVALLLTVVAIGIAATLHSKLERERVRADALALRVAALEPVERPGHTQISRTELPIAPPSSIDVERDDKPTAPADPPLDVQKSYKGSLEARRLVERLRMVLADKTPLQEYQIQPLIIAVDRVRAEQPDRTSGAQPDAQAIRNQRLVQATSDVLFESQLEQLIALIEREPPAL